MLFESSPIRDRESRHAAQVNKPPGPSVPECCCNAGYDFWWVESDIGGWSGIRVVL